MTALPTVPGAEDFRALARSSPLRWSSVRVAFRATGSAGSFLPPTAPTDPGVRAWVRRRSAVRPSSLRVETLTGDLVQAGVEHQSVGSTSFLMVADDDSVAAHGTVVPEPPLAPEPRQRPDGLLAYRPGWAARQRFPDAPMFQNYYWVAMFDPFELTAPFFGGDDDGPATTVEEVTLVDHHGRPAWEALVRPLDGYDPRCSCCPLLDSAQADDAEAEAGAAPQRPPGFAYADAYRVRLDVGTGICVLVAEVGGSRPGNGHDLTIEAVDEPMPDSLFVDHPVW